MLRNWRLIILVVLLVWPSIAGAGPCDAPKPIRFAAGARAAELTGGVARGELACFTITARKGQSMAISPARQATDVVMQIYQPPWTIVPSPDGIRVQGRPLPGAAEGEDATSWAGKLPETGRYLLVVGASWGGVEYHLRVEIR